MVTERFLHQHQVGHFAKPSIRFFCFAFFVLYFVLFVFLYTTEFIIVLCFAKCALCRYCFVHINN